MCIVIKKAAAIINDNWGSLLPRYIIYAITTKRKTGFSNNLAIKLGSLGRAKATYMPKNKETTGSTYLFS